MKFDTETILYQATIRTASAAFAEALVAMCPRFDQGVK